MKSRIVEVTQADIDEAAMKRECDPVALALARFYQRIIGNPPDNVSVGIDRLVMSDADMTWSSITPVIVRKHLIQFDMGKPIKPFEFRWASI